MWTSKELEGFKPQKKRYRITEKTHQRSTGRLVIEILPSGLKQFFFQYHFRSKKILIKIGIFAPTTKRGGVTLAEAREKQRECHAILNNGYDVKTYLAAQKIKEIDQQKSDIERGSFAELINSYTAQMRADGKRTAQQVEIAIKHYVYSPFPELEKKKANQITVDDIKLVLYRMINDLGVTTQANRVRSYLHAAFQHGLKQDNNPRNYLAVNLTFNLTINPVAAIPRQSDYERVGERYLSEDEIKQLWQVRVSI